MITLALDCSTGAGSIALERDGQIWKHSLLESGTQAAQLVPIIKELCAQADCHATDITRIYCPVGPGSFTGIRISLTVARILSFTTNAEAIGVSTLDAFALSHEGDSDFTVATRAGKGQAYLQHYRAGEPLTHASDIEIVDIAALDNPAIGNLEQCTTTLPVPDMRQLLLKKNLLARTYPLEALYVRAPDADPAKPLEARK